MRKKKGTVDGDVGVEADNAESKKQKDERERTHPHRRRTTAHFSVGKKVLNKEDDFASFLFECTKLFNS